MCIMPMRDLEEAHFRWCDYYGLEPSRRKLVLHDCFKTFAHLHGSMSVTWADGGRGELIRVPERTKQRLELLLNTHWRTLLRAYEIKKKDVQK